MLNIRSCCRFDSVICAGLLIMPAPCSAQTDEIEIYDATIADRGQTELTFHSNYTPDGRTQADFPGGVIPNHSINGAFEFAYGARDDLELGLYLPVYTITAQGRPEFEGAKVRALWVVPHAREREFFYGVNFELSVNARRWDSSRTGLEVRPILGWHEGKLDLIVNPIIDTNFKGIGNSHFAPAERIALNTSGSWSFGAELYSDIGPVDHAYPWRLQSHTLFGVVDYNFSETHSLEFGIGQGLTDASDHRVLKLIWNHAL